MKRGVHTITKREQRDSSSSSSHSGKYTSKTFRSLSSTGIVSIQGWIVSSQREASKSGKRVLSLSRRRNSRLRSSRRLRLSQSWIRKLDRLLLLRNHSRMNSNLWKVLWLSKLRGYWLIRLLITTMWGRLGDLKNGKIILYMKRERKL